MTESVQQLVDRNRIVSKRTEVYARDGEGRTRREMGLVTFIHDPVAMAQAPPTVVTQERIEIRRYRSSRVLRSRGSL